MSINVKALTAQVKQIATNQTKRADAILQAAHETTVGKPPATPTPPAAPTKEGARP